MSDPTPYDHAIAVVNRYRHGWEARRDSFGFLKWWRSRSDEWEGMTNGEALAWHDANDRAWLASRQAIDTKESI